MLKFEMQLLGAPLWLLDGAPIKGFVTRKAEALLIYLAVNQHIHRRSTLAACFWPEVAEEHARNNLRRTFSNLRTLVGSHLHIDRYTAAFDTQSTYALDVEQFTTLLTPIGGGDAQRSPSVANQEKALVLYRADFLEGFLVHDAPLFEEWARQKREYLHLEMFRSGLQEAAEWQGQRRWQAAGCLD